MNNILKLIGLKVKELKRYFESDVSIYIYFNKNDRLIIYNISSYDGKCIDDIQGKTITKVDDHSESTNDKYISILYK